MNTAKTVSIIVCSKRGVFLSLVNGFPVWSADTKEAWERACSFVNEGVAAAFYQKRFVTGHDTVSFKTVTITKPDEGFGVSRKQILEGGFNIPSPSNDDSTDNNSSGTNLDSLCLVTT